MSLISAFMKPTIGLLLVMLLAVTTWAQTADGDWTTYNRTYAGERFSPLKEITTANVSTLRTVCTFDTGETVGFQSGPLVVSGVMYFTTFKNTYAIDAGTCALKWKHEHAFAGPEGLGANRGLGYLDGKLFRGANDGHVFAIDANSGKTVWDVAIADPARGETVPMAPVAWNGMVFVGNAGGDNFGVTGRVYALDAVTGKQVWRFVTVPTLLPCQRPGPSGRLTIRLPAARYGPRSASILPPVCCTSQQGTPRLTSSSNSTLARTSTRPLSSRSTQRPAVCSRTSSRSRTIFTIGTSPPRPR